MTLPVLLMALTALLIGLLAPISSEGDDDEVTQQELVATATALAAEHTGEDPMELPPGVFTYPHPESLPAAIVMKVIDGDTIEVRVAGELETIRYFGIDTPERGELCYEEAKERNEELVGRHVLLLADARERDRSSRLLRYVFTLGGQSVDAALIAEGFAHAWTRDGFYRDTLMALEEDAQRESRGCLWGDGEATP